LNHRFDRGGASWFHHSQLTGPVSFLHLLAAT